MTDHNQKAAIHRARIIWESRNPQHEINSDTGEDMFWKTMTMCMEEYASKADEEKDKEIERLKGLIEIAFKDPYKRGRVHPGNNMNKDFEQFKTENNL